MAKYKFSYLCIMMTVILVSLSCSLDAKRSKSASKKSSKMASLAKGDPVLQYINKNFVTLQDDECKTYMVHYQRVLNELVSLMKREDVLFESLFSKLFWAGSYYDGLKVGKPEEYDVDMVLKLPIDYAGIEVVSHGVDRPFVKLRAPGMVADTFRKNPKPAWKEIYKPLDKWTDADGFLLQNKLRTWIESVVSRTLLKLQRQGNAFVLVIAGQRYLVTQRKTGPAMTFFVVLPSGVQIDVDLVPVLEFNSAIKWPPAPVRDSPRGQSWFAVPKPNSQRTEVFQATYWRLGFHDQERALLSGKQLLKPVCKLLKKLRDNSPLFKNLASYYIKTMFLWEEFDPKDSKQWGLGITAVFLNMLRRLGEKLETGRIEYFWDRQYNLISGMSEQERDNLAHRIKAILKEIEKRFPEDPTILAKFLLTPSELALFNRNYRSANDINYEFENASPDDVTPVENTSSCCIL